MARKLKTYQTSAGFFDLAIAAPSMKAALEAWGSNSNLFHRGFASEATDPRVITATMKRPGVILKRPVGSNGPFTEHAELPTNLSAVEVNAKADKPHRQPKASPSPKADDKTARKAALAFEREQWQREGERRKEAAAEAKKRERRQQAIDKAEATLAEAKEEHDRRAGVIEKERAELERRAEQEDERWEKLRKRLETALRQAHD